MTGKWLPLTAAAAVLLAGLAGCTDAPTPGSSASTSPSGPQASAPTATQSTAASSPAPSPSSTLPAGIPPGAINYSVTDWAIPSGTPLELGSSLGQYPAALLESVEFGKHPEGKPSFTRVSFRFRGAMPTCRLQYVKEFRGTDDKVVTVAGNAHLAATFVTAQGPASGAAPVTGDGAP